MANREDLIGLKFGKLTVIEYAGYKNRKPHWRCKCECGNYKTASTYNLKNGYTTSCGCIVNSKEFKRYKHGLTKHPLYHIYHSMKQRCFNKNNDMYKHYGARGITICDEWLGEDGFNSFYEWSVKNGYNNNLTIDRINVNNDYSPDNCRWVDNETQMNNTTRNKRFEYNGESHTCSEWAEILNNGVSKLEIYSRIVSLGWDVEKALFTPTIVNEKPNVYRWNEMLTHNERTQTISEWCNEVGISKDNYRSRLKLGWDEERAATTPKRCTWINTKSW